MTNFDLRKVAVGGLGITGRAVTEALTARGYEVVAFDDNPDAVAAIAEQLEVELLDSTSDEQIREGIREATSLLPSPGMFPDHRLSLLAKEADVPSLSELDLGASFDDRPLVAVTGTNGKTTVTELTTRMLNEAQIKAAAVGNTEVPLVRAIDDPAKYEVFVVEASSFSLQRTQLFRPTAAAWLNLAPDHLDWHGSFHSYALAKSKIWANQEETDFAVAPYADERVDPWLAGVTAQLVTFGLGAGDVHCTESELIAHGERVIAIKDMSLARPHDKLNACAAVALALAMGVSPYFIAEVLSSFEGLEHRMENVSGFGPIRFFNDSKATTPHATIAALNGFDNAVLIVGGRNKGLDLSALLEVVPALKGVVVIGESGSTLVDLFGQTVPSAMAYSMKDAVEKAVRFAEPSAADVVLSPACASFDWYANYIERGNDFKKVVHELKAEQELL